MPARLLVRHPDGRVEERPPQDLSELRDRTCWLDLADPDDRDLDLAADERRERHREHRDLDRQASAVEDPAISAASSTS